MNTKFFFTLAFISAIFYSCVNDKSEVELITKKINLPVESAVNIEVLYSDSAKVKAKLKAPLMNRYLTPKPYVEMPKGIDLKFFDDTLNIISTITANYAISRESDDIMEARNDVVVVNKKGEQLNTEHLIWDQKIKKIYSTVFAKITTKDEIIIGNGFEANEDFTNYKINKVKGVFNVSKEKHAPDS
ncbi:MAG TPA: LPS export ABC transporter periplasmic protein LptC [Bacteroidia bacterium]|nr:LPS export ABC transporter periplasmic protein LptC [Bacteroidia bacterium]